MGSRFSPRARSSARSGRRRSRRPSLMRRSGLSARAGFAYTLTGILTLFALARWIECRNPSFRRPGPPFPPPFRRLPDGRRDRLPPSLHAASARADEACLGARVAFDANGAKWLPKVRVGGALDILAIGSSSTEGIGASGPTQTYPARLQDELGHELGIPASVRNAGIGGEVAARTLPRLLAALASAGRAS